MPQCRYVLIGDATHGTQEFYDIRSELTKLLLEQRGFTAVLLESDFPDAWQVNAFVRSMSPDKSARHSLGAFKRFPRWVWRNLCVLSFVEWLHAHNARLRGGRDGGDAAAAASLGGDQQQQQQVGVYGMDVYALHASAAAVVDFLKGVDPEAAEQVSRRYRCFHKFGGDARAYALATAVFRHPSCAGAAERVVEILRGCVGKAAGGSEDGDAPLDQEHRLMAEANAVAVADGEAYYRAMFCGEEGQPWNARDTHFLQSVKLIQGSLSARADAPPGGARVVVWAHNSHLGDARAMEMGWRRGQVNLGQLMRREFGQRAVCLVGLTTYQGSVTAAEEWGEPEKERALPEALPGSWEALLHATGHPALVLDLRAARAAAVLQGVRLQRAIGATFPLQAPGDAEALSNYSDARLVDQFDLLAHVDVTHALQPMDGG